MNQTGLAEFIPSGVDLIGETINREHALARQCVETGFEHAIRCGELLAQQKGALPHGQFIPWVEANCAFTDRQARRYMEVASKTDPRVRFDSLRQALGYGSNTLALKHTGDEESYTPIQYIDAARAVMGSIDLDPASNDLAQETVRAAKYYTSEDDGLTLPWRGRVWMNPPYTALVINEFIDKLIEGYSAGDIEQAVVLTNNNTDTSWFHEAAAIAAAVCFTRGRINFNKADGTTSSPTNGQSFFYFGPDLPAFVSAFSAFGLVVVRA